MTFPFFNPRILSLAGSGTKSLETSIGPVPTVSTKHTLTSQQTKEHIPMGQAPSKPLEKFHWLWASWLSRLETSLHAEYPRTYSIASASETFLAVLPRTIASSDSKSLVPSFCEILGMKVGVGQGSPSAVFGFINMVGICGSSIDTSSACRLY